MQIHGPKRVYNVSSLESWFERLVESWEPNFSGSSLEMGRQFYREGLVREIELGEQDAIVHSKIDGRDCHVVIEWKAKRLESRASIPEPRVGEALAVAGLYEIEEMIVDEMSPVPVAAETNEPPEESAENSLRAMADARRAPDKPERSMVLEFDVSEKGLRFTPFWVDRSGGEERRAPAMPHARNGDGSIVSTERELLIRLASLARKAQFRLCQESGAYVLENAARIRSLVTNDLPAWKKFFAINVSPSVERLKQGVRKVEVSAEAKRGQKGGIDLKWLFRSGEELLQEDEFARLERAEGDGPVLLPRLGFVELGKKERKALGQWKERLRTAGKEEVPRYLLLSLFDDSDLNVEASKEINEWKREVLKPPAELPGLPDFLRGYQRQGVSWMARLAELDCHGLLADEMGLGKTVQTLALLAARPTEERIHLIVTPASVVPVWEKEAARFFPDLAIEVLRAGNNFVDRSREAVWIASYNQVRRHQELLAKVRFGYAILDEGQLIKNPAAKIARCCFSIQARHRFVLTGTPLENRRLDLWSLFHFLMPGLLGSRAGFEAGAADKEKFMPRLRAQIAPFVMRRAKTHVASELPPKVEMVVAAPLSRVQREEYARICQEGLTRLGDALEPAMRERSFGLFSLLTRLRQVCCDPGLLPWQETGYGESGKTTALLDQLAGVLDEGHKVVVFSQFVSFLNRIDGALDENFPAVARYRLTGSTIDREAPVAAFQDHDGAAIMLVSLRAGGTGITLHSADYVFLLDPWWNPAVEEQAIDRVHRIGQTRPVTVCRIVTSGTIEQRIQNLKEEKRELFESLVGHLGAIEGMRDRFQSLRDLIELAEEAEEE